MNRGNYIGLAGVLGGSVESAGIGSVKWFPNGEPIPENYVLADGSGLDLVRNYADLVNSGAIIPGASRMVFSSSMLSWTGQPNVNPNGYYRGLGRDLLFSSEYALGLYSTSNSFIWLSPLYIGPRPFGNENQTLAISGSIVYSGTTLSATGLCNGNVLIFISNKKLCVGPSLLSLANAYTEYTLADTNVLDPVYFKGKYYSGSATELRVCAGPGAWATWDAIPVTGRTGSFMEILTDGNRLVAFTTTGEVFSSTDGVTFTEHTVTGLTTNLANGSRVVFDGNKTWAAYSFLDKAIYTSEDLVTFVNRGRPLGASEATQGFSGAGGMLFICGSTAADAAFTSIDGGETWQKFASTAEGTWMNTTRPLHAALGPNGAVILGAPAGGGNGSGGAYYAIGNRLPSYPPLLKGGTTYRAYVRVF